MIIAVIFAPPMPVPCQGRELYTGCIKLQSRGSRDVEAVDTGGENGRDRPGRPHPRR